MLTLFACLAALFLCTTAVACWGVIKLAHVVFDLEDSIEESLDSLDTQYQRVAQLADRPVLLDEPSVRELVGVIRATRDLLLKIAQKMSVFGKRGDVEEES